MYLFLPAKKSYFAYLFLWMVRFGKFRVYKFQPQRKNKNETVESRNIRQFFLPRSTERQAGHDGENVAIDWF